MIWEALRTIGRGVAFAVKALVVTYWFLISFLLGAALLGGFIAMAGAFAGWSDVKLFGSALLAIGAMGSFFLLMLGSMGPVPLPTELDKPAQPNGLDRAKRKNNDCIA
jgi:hypothetical protein